MQKHGQVCALSGQSNTTSVSNELSHFEASCSAALSRAQGIMGGDSHTVLEVSVTRDCVLDIRAWINFMFS